MVSSLPRCGPRCSANCPRQQASSGKVWLSPAPALRCTVPWLTASPKNGRPSLENCAGCLGERAITEETTYLPWTTFTTFPLFSSMTSFVTASKTCSHRKMASPWQGEDMALAVAVASKKNTPYGGFTAGSSVAWQGLPPPADTGGRHLPFVCGPPARRE